MALAGEIIRREEKLAIAPQTAGAPVE